jgi:hypothetical protein
MDEAMRGTVKEIGLDTLHLAKSIPRGAGSRWAEANERLTGRGPKWPMT